MKLLTPEKYKNIRSLFHKNYPNLPVVYGIIEQILPGQIWVDNENNPNVSLVMSIGAYCFIAGKVNDEILQDCVELLKKKQMVKLAIESDANIEMSKFGFVAVARRQYRYKNPQPIVPLFINDSGYILKKIEDEETLNLCMWKSLVHSIFGDSENYLKNGMSFILWDPHKQMLASEVHGIPSKEFIEVGTITREEYRNKKLSTILCNHLIRYSLHKGLKPVWSCDESNVISWKVAEKQGMDELIRYTFQTWNQSL